MNLTGYAKRLTVRAAERRVALAAKSMREWPLPVGERAQIALAPVEDGTGHWLPAGLVDVHDEVNAAGAWRAVTGTTMTAAQLAEQGSVELRFDGRREPMSGLTLVYARDPRTMGGGDAA